MKKLALETVIERCNEKFNGKYDYSQSVFINIRTPFNVICPKHGVFSITPKRHMNGQGCPECGKEYARNWRKGKWNEFLDKFVKKYGDNFDFPYIETEYENKFSQLTMYCKRCGTKYEVQAAYLLTDRFNGCTDCKYFYSFDDLSKHNQTDNKMVQFDGLKDSRKDKVLLICNEHGEYNVSVSTILNGKGKCSKCNGHQRLLTQVEAYRRINEKYGDAIEPISPYIRSDLQMLFKCKNGHIFSRDFNTAMCSRLLTPCPDCSKAMVSKMRTKTLDKFIQDAINKYGEGKYDFTDSVYVASNGDITIKCNECGRYFTIEANSFLQGHGCPFHNCNSSLMEKELASLIESYGYDTLTNTRNVLGNGKEIDVYITELKIAFEFDGIYWHNELNKDKNYHLDKTLDCERKGITLYHIFEDEWLNKKEVVISMINDIFGKNQTIIEGNKCVLNNISIDEANGFLSTNHIQCSCNGTINYGLFDNNELISVISFTIINDNEYELVRFANKINYKVNQAESILFNKFIEDCKPHSVIFNADRRWNQGALANKLGLDLISEIKPNYYYVIGNERKDKSLFTKQILEEQYGCPKDVSGHDFCLSQKWYRIYDCGALQYKRNF